MEESGGARVEDEGALAVVEGARGHELEGGVARGVDVGGGEGLIVEPAGPRTLGFADDGARAVPGGAGGGVADAGEALLEVAARRTRGWRRRCR